MTTQLDCSIGLKQETEYGAGVTVDRHVEFLTESLKWAPEFKQGEGMRYGSRVPRASRRALVKQQASGDVELEVMTKGMGVFLNALFGKSTVTQVATTQTYQQVHTLTDSDPLPSYTIQKGIPLIGGGAVQPYTFHGAVCASGELTASAGEIVKLKTTWNAREVLTSTAFAPPTYPVDGNLFTFVHGAIRLGGEVVPPTATELATGGTEAANITEFTLTLDNKIDEGGFTFGSGGMRGRKPVVGVAEVKGKITAEYTDNVLRDAYLNQEQLTLVLEFTAPEDGSGVVPVLQIHAPVIYLEGEIPAAGGTDPKTQSIDFTVLDPAISGVSPLYGVYVSSDTAI